MYMIVPTFKVLQFPFLPKSLHSLQYLTTKQFTIQNYTFIPITFYLSKVGRFIINIETMYSDAVKKHEGNTCYKE